jgi:hypothetical protein
VHNVIFYFSFIISRLGKKAIDGFKNYEIKVINAGYFYGYYIFVTYGPGIYFVGLVKNITDG